MLHFRLYTDGACSGNPGRGGWAAIVLDEKNDNIMQHSGGFRHTTNNRMEIMAVANGLNDLADQIENRRDTDIKVTVFSDSQLVVNTMNEGWGRKSNLDLWRELDKAADRFEKVEFKKVKGHADDGMNNLADETAVAASSPDRATGVDAYYESINGYPFRKDENRLFDIGVSETPTVKNIYLLYNDQPENRKIEVSLSNGAIVSIVGLYGDFEQFNCTRTEAAITVDIAHRFTKWLNGGSL